MEHGKRIQWIDTARAIAIVLVVLCHSVSSYYSFSLEAFWSYGTPSRIASFALMTVGRLGVPFFLFMSGYLLLDRRYDDAHCRRFWKRKWLQLVISAEAWIVIYDLFVFWYGSEPLSATAILKDMLFLDQVSLGHYWYIPMIIGLYLFVPIMSNALRAVNSRTLMFPVAVVFAVAFVVPVLSEFDITVGGSGFHSVLEMGYSGGVYGCYMILGMLVKRGVFNSVPFAALGAAGAVLFSGVVWFQIYCHSSGVEYNVFYQDAGLALAALCLFVLLSRASKPPCGRIVKLLAKYSFAIYLIHFPIRVVLAPYIGRAIALIPMLGSAVANIIVLSVVVLILSLAAALLISRIPFIGPKLLYMRN